MKKSDLKIGMAVDFKNIKNVMTGIITDLNVYQAAVDVVNDLGEVLTIQVPYKDVLAMTK